MVDGERAGGAVPRDLQARGMLPVSAREMLDILFDQEPAWPKLMRSVSGGWLGGRESLREIQETQ
ncbi:MAG: hypothetical protein Q7R30_08120 [Acidobacteriota bacterium]|nr:hypothetical protein [Acidobacteriota bacterium]